MNTNEQKEEIKSFLQNFSYNIMHESGKHNIEHYFVVITKEDLNTTILKIYFDAYIKKFPITDVSLATQEFMNNANQEYYFINIDNIDHNDPFFKEKDYFIRTNANNIICIKMINEPADFSTHIENNLDIYLEQFKGISLDIGILAKEKIKDRLQQSKHLFNEKKPVIKKNIHDISSKLKTKIKSFTTKKR